MSILIQNSPEALEYCQRIERDLSNYLLFDGEQFQRTLFAVLATSDLDLQGEVIPASELARYKEEIDRRVIWMGAEHDPLIHKVGRVVAADLFHDVGADVHFVAGVIGCYDRTKLASFADIGVDINNIEPKEPEPSDLESSPPFAEVTVSRGLLDSVKSKGLLDDAPSFVRLSRKVRVQKAADPLTILGISVAFWVLAANPFSKKFLEKYGEAAADQSLKFWRWLGDKVVGFLTSAKPQRFETVSEYKGCILQFVPPTGSPDLLEDAFRKLTEAAQRAKALVDQIEPLAPDWLVFDFDTASRSWFPLHAATRERGVIVDRPVLIAMENYRGISIDGYAEAMSVEIDDSNE